MHNLSVENSAEGLSDDSSYVKEGGRERYFAVEKVSMCVRSTEF